MLEHPQPSGAWNIFPVTFRPVVFGATVPASALLALAGSGDL